MPIFRCLRQWCLAIIIFGFQLSAFLHQLPHYHLLSCSSRPKQPNITECWHFIQTLFLKLIVSCQSRTSCQCVTQPFSRGILQEAELCYIYGKREIFKQPVVCS